MTTEPDNEPTLPTITGAQMAKSMGMLPSDFFAMVRNVQGEPRIHVLPRFTDSNGWPHCDVRCTACGTVESDELENATIKAYRHNIQLHAGQLDVNTISLSGPHDPPADTRLPEAWLKWNRGNKRLLRLVSRCQEWAATIDLAMTRDVLDDGWTRYTIMAPQESVPVEFSLDLGEAIGQLRSSLDVATCELSNPHRRNAMPCETDRQKWPTRKKESLRSLTPAIRTVIERYQPFSANPLNPEQTDLYRLTDLWNADKHRLLPGAVGAFWYGQVEVQAPEQTVEKRNELPRLSVLDDDVTLVEVRSLTGGDAPHLSLRFVNVRVLFLSDRDGDLATPAIELLDLANAARQLLAELDAAAGATHHAAGL